MEHEIDFKPARSRRRAIATSFALVAAGTFIGVSSQNFVSADISTGDRPVLIPIEPCRLSDTRPGDNQVGPRSAPLAAADTHTIDAQEPGTPCTGKIPTDALALSLNVTALNATELSFLTIWAGGDRPLAASLNPAPGQPPVPNAVTTQLSVDQEFEVYNNAGTVNIVIDVNGYYTNHNHDDRYALKEDVQSPIQIVTDELQFFATAEDDGSFPRPGQVLYSFDVDVPAGTTVVEITSVIKSFFDDSGPIGVQGRGYSCWLEIDDDPTRIAETPLSAREKFPIDTVATWTAVVDATSARTLTTDLLCSPPADGEVTAQHPRGVATSYPG